MQAERAFLAGRPHVGTPSMLSTSLHAFLLRAREVGACSAEADATVEWLPRVHALNLCRLIFLDKTFSLHTMPFVGSRIHLGARVLMADPHWPPNTGIHGSRAPGSGVHLTGHCLSGSFSSKRLFWRYAHDQGDSPECAQRVRRVARLLVHSPCSFPPPRAPARRLFLTRM